MSAVEGGETKQGRKALLAREDFQKILERARECLPEEACGLIAGRDEEGGNVRRIEAVYLLTNTDHSHEHFSLDPGEQLQAVKDMRSRGLSPLGNWHSHPESPSRPSEEDIRLSFDRHASYLILSLMEEEPVLNSFHVEEGIVTKEELVITD